MPAPSTISAVGSIEQSSTQGTSGNDPVGAVSTRDAGCQTLPYQAHDREADDQDQGTSGTQLRQQKPALVASDFVPGGFNMLLLNYHENKEKTNPATMARAAHHPASWIVNDSQYSENKSVVDGEQTSSGASSVGIGGAPLTTNVIHPLVLTAAPHIENNQDPEDQSVVIKGHTSSEASSPGGAPLMTNIFHPLVLTATPHIPFDPASSKSDHLEPTVSAEEDFLPEHLKPLVRVFHPVMQPTIRRKGPHRVPPPTPPEVVREDRLSMPTLPSLHNNSHQDLIECYRLEYRHNPEKFKAITKMIKYDLVRMKVARGGENFLLENEYTVELASRLDAVTAEVMCAVRNRNNQVESEHGDDKDNGGDNSRSCSYKEYARIDRARLLKEPVVLEYNRHLDSEYFEDGSKRRTYVKTIKVTQTINVSAEEGDEPRVTGEDTEDTEDNTVGEVAELLRVMAAQVDDL